MNETAGKIRSCLHQQKSSCKGMIKSPSSPGTGRDTSACFALIGNRRNKKTLGHRTNWEGNLCNCEREYHLGLFCVWRYRIAVFSVTQ